MTREQKQHILHFAVSSLGGFMGGYAIYNHCDVFGNAQTANMIHLVSKIFTGDFDGVVFIVIALLTYILGNVFFVIADRFIKLETKTVSLIASTVALLIIGIFPNISNNYLAILPILFVTPVLWNSFRTAGSYVTSPIFSTNNLRVATVSTFTGIIDKDKDMKKKDLYAKAGISPASVTKMGRNGHVTTEILLKICTALDCGVEDIMEIVPHKID